MLLAFIAGRLTTDEAASEDSAVAATPTSRGPTTTGTAAPGAAKTRDDISPGGPVTLVGVPEVIDTSTLRIEGNLIRLFGVEWARGGQSEDLVRYLRGRATTCRPTGAGDLYRCDVDGRDLSRVVLYNGGGRATADAPPELVAAEESCQGREARSLEETSSRQPTHRKLSASQRKGSSRHADWRVEPGASQCKTSLLVLHSHTSRVSFDHRGM